MQDDNFMSTRMRPLAEFPARARRDVRFVLFDIDETLTTGGRLTAEAYGALEDLQNAGLLTAAVTGRPAGWCDHIARMWPVDGVAGENGAFYYRYDHTARRMISHYAADQATLAANRDRMEKLRRRILTEVPGAGVSSDQFCLARGRDHFDFDPAGGDYQRVHIGHCPPLDYLRQGPNHALDPFFPTRNH